MSILSQEEKEAEGQRIRDMSRLTSEDKQLMENMFDYANSYLWDSCARSDVANMDDIQKMSNKFRALLIKVRKL